MECRWENFGIEPRDVSGGLGLAIPTTTSLQQFMSLAECTGPKAISRLCLEAANLLHATATLLFDDWELALEPDERSRLAGKNIVIDPAALHIMAKTESVPDYIVNADHTVLRNLVTFSGNLPNDLHRIAEGLEIGKPAAAMEIGLNLRNLQLVVQSHGGRLLFTRGVEFLELPSPADP